MEFPVIAVPDGSDLLDTLNVGKINVRSSFVRTQNKITSVFLQIPSFTETDVSMLSIEFEALLLERDRGPGMLVTSFPIA